MEIYAHFAMYNVVSLSVIASSKPYIQGKYQYQIDIKMACCIWRRYFSISDNSNKSFTQLLLDMAFYLISLPGKTLALMSGESKISRASSCARLDP